MSKKLHRISASGIVIHNNKVLLVRYSQGYLVAPGGGVKEGESLQETAKREIFEETGITVIVKQPIMVEIINAGQKIHSKTWFLCEFKSGEISESEASIKEGIIECGWCNQDSLKNELVYPSIVQSMPFQDIQNYSGTLMFPEIRNADF